MDKRFTERVTQLVSRNFLIIIVEKTYLPFSKCLKSNLRGYNFLIAQENRFFDISATSLSPIGFPSLHR